MGFKLNKMDQFCLILLHSNKIEVGIDVERTCPYDKFKAVKKYTTKILCCYSKINTGDSCLKIKKR